MPSPPLLSTALLLSFVAAYLAVAFTLDRDLPWSTRLGWLGVSLALLTLGATIASRSP